MEDETGRPVELRVGEWGLGEQILSKPADPPAVTDPDADSAAKRIYVFVGGMHAATIELQENWREGLEAALQELEVLGVEAAILTGDPAVATGRFHSVNLRTGMSPADKHLYVQELVASGRSVTFVGDGVNDAAAMSAAQASIAMQAGADLAHAAAMAVYAGGDLRFLPRAITVARAARRSIRLNLQFAAAYNIVGMALAAAGVLHPVAAALLMVGSSAFVSVNALRGR